MADNKDGRTEVLGDLNFDSLEQQWRQKQMGAPGAAPPPASAAPQDSTMALDVSAADLESDMSTVSLSAAQLANIPQFAALTGQPAKPAPMPGMPPGFGAPPGAPPGFGAPQPFGAPPGAPPGFGAPQPFGAPPAFGAPPSPPPVFGAPPGMGGPLPGAPTEALRLEDVEAMMSKGPGAPAGSSNQLVVGSADPAIHGSPTAALPPVALAPGQVQIKHTGSQPIYRPQPKKNTGMIVGIVVMVLVLIGAAVAAVFLVGGKDATKTEATDTKPTDKGPDPNTPPAADKPLAYVDALKATAALSGFNLIDLDKAASPPQGAELISASAKHGVRLSHVDLKAKLAEGPDALTKALGERADIKGAPLVYALPFELTFQDAFALLDVGAKAGHATYLGSRTGSVVQIEPTGWGGKAIAEAPALKVRLSAAEVTLSGPKVDPSDEEKTERVIAFGDEAELDDKLDTELRAIAARNDKPTSVQLTVAADVQVGYAANALMTLYGPEESPLFKSVLLTGPVK